MEEYKGIEFKSIDIENDEDGELLVEKYQIRSVPTIVLADENGDLISSSGRVELVFPYKDCVLEGGQTKEDQRRQEVFYNGSLAKDEVDRLLYPKVFASAIKYSADGKQPVTEFCENDNLIIRGNNLLSLASILRRFEGRVKCIYIDNWSRDVSLRCAA
jgi:adenine-specific DNA-methyltransferase